MNFGDLDRWLRLDRESRWKLLGLMITLPLVSVGLWLFGLRRMQRWLDAASPLPRSGSADFDGAAAARLGRLVEIAGRRGPIRCTCLRQALLLRFLLRRRGIETDLRLGVSKGDGVFSAHAWLEFQGKEVGLGRASFHPLLEKAA